MFNRNPFVGIPKQRNVGTRASRLATKTKKAKQLQKLPNNNMEQSAIMGLYNKKVVIMCNLEKAERVPYYCYQPKLHGVRSRQLRRAKHHICLPYRTHADMHDTLRTPPYARTQSRGTILSLTAHRVTHLAYYNYMFKRVWVSIVEADGAFRVETITVLFLLVECV